MIHIDTKELDKLIFAPEELNSEQKSEYLQHIESCAYCRDYFELAKEFYENFEKEVAEGQSEQVQEKALKFFYNEIIPQDRSIVKQKKVEDAISTFFEVIEPKRPLPQRIVNYVKVHPVKSVGGFAIAACLLMIITFFFRACGDKNPDFAKAKDRFLVVYNKDGNELWRKKVGVGFDYLEIITRYQLQNVEPETYLDTEDIDGDGTREVIATFNYSDWKYKNKLYCYDASGKEKWVYTFNREMKFGNEKFENIYVIPRFCVGDFDKNGKKEIIAVATHDGKYPSCLFVLNASDGKLISEYWHSGVIWQIDHRDVDNDGIEEIFAIGLNNGYDLASIAVLDPKFIIGHSPAPLNYTPINVTAGMEKYYLLIDRSDIKDFVIGKRNEARMMKPINDKLFDIDIFETIAHNEYCFALYYFDSTMQCYKTDVNDTFVNFRNRLVREGRLKGAIDQQYLENLRRGIQYWNGETFVYTPTMNKRYLELVNREGGNQQAIKK